METTILGLYRDNGNEMETTIVGCGGIIGLCWGCIGIRWKVSGLGFRVEGRGFRGWHVGGLRVWV